MSPDPMGGGSLIPGEPGALDALAAEYVVGTLEGREAAAVARALAVNPALRAAVSDWEARLAPLLELAPPQAPPEGLWKRIEASLTARPAAPAPVPLAAWRGRLLKGWAGGATALAAGLAAFLLLRPAEMAPSPMMTVLLRSQDQPAWLVEAAADGIRLASLNPVPVQEGRVQQLWALAPGATAPVSLGLIPAEGRRYVAPARVRPEPGMLIEITLEPPGGSPTGRPTGPVLFIGRLAAASGS